MLIVIGVLLGAFIGAGLFSGFGSEAWIGAAMGGLAAWLWQVQTRLRRLEHNLQRRPARSAPVLGGERERE